MTGVTAVVMTGVMTGAADAGPGVPARGALAR